MPLSKRLQRLITRLRVLERHFLPVSFSLTGKYSPQQTDHTKAYLLFTHAELESYFEDVAHSRAELAERRWTRQNQCTPVLSRLLVFHHATEKKELGPLNTTAVTKALNYYTNMIEGNHGIKENHLLAIFLPIGLNHTDLDTQLIAACNQLSQKRGQFAHTSFKTHQQIDPKTERDNIWNNIIPQLEKLDDKVKKL